ncbi:MAG: hypothetical protein GX257_07215 [Clostridiales bacterium]|jgi:hypothetical protein|nr:hypothetical protein [Clostridiales bacterium]
MAKLFNNENIEITATTSPSIADLAKKYGQWVEVLADGGRLESDGIYSKDGECFYKFNDVRRGTAIFIGSNPVGRIVRFPLKYGLGIMPVAGQYKEGDIPGFQDMDGNEIFSIVQ